MESSGVQSLVVWQIARAIVLFPAQAPAAPWENEVGGRRSMVKKVISFALIGVFSATLLVACGQPSEKVEPTVTREAVEIPETTASTPAAPEGTTASTGETGASGSGLTIDAVDIAWSTKTLSGPADQEFTITVTNKGQATHDFAIPDLNIETKMLAPGESATVTVNAPAGDYQYLCTVPGHAEAGMTGTLTLAAGTALPGGSTEASPAAGGAEAGAATAGAATGGETNLNINAIDIAWEEKTLTGPADQDFTITVTNKGQATHDFAIPDLGIQTEMLQPGQSATVTVNAPAGDYQYKCTVPGHAEAGMVGTLTLVAGGGAASGGEATAATESTPGGEATASTEAAATASGGETNLTIDAVDIAWSAKTLTGPADQEFTITVTNKGQATHDFAIPDLNVMTEMLAPGQSATVTVNAPAGDYQYKCTVPGHAEAGMVGTLTLVAGGGAASGGEATAATESTPGGEATASTEAAATASGGETNLTIDAVDIAWSTKTLTGPADQDFTITVTNKGQATHDFAIPDLN